MPALGSGEAPERVPARGGSIVKLSIIPVTPYQQNC
jgi:hypothetical protein